MENNNQDSVQDRQESRPFAYVLILFFVMAFFVQSNLIWLTQDTLPPSWDPAGHMLLSLRYARSITETGALNALKEFFSISHYYPPLFYLTAAPIIIFFGFSEDKLIMINFLYLFLFLISMYGIGKLLFNRRAGILAAVLCLFYPIMYALSREFLLDFALVSMVTCVQYLILKSEGGCKKPWNILLGIAAGAALLIKPAALLFFLPLWVYVFIRRWKQTKNLSPLTACFLISLGIALPWYFFAFKDLLALNSYYWQNFAMTVEGDPNQFFPSLLWYADALRVPLMSPHLFKFFLAGLFLFILIGRRWHILLMFACWVVPAFFILIVTPNKDGRYLMPILPALSLLTVAGIDTVRVKAIRNTLYFFMIAIGFLQFNNLSFNISPDLIKEKSPYYYNQVPLQQDWKNREVMDYLSEHFPNKHMTIGVLPNCKYFNPSELDLYAYLFRLPYSIEEVGDSSVSFEDIKRFDIFITKYPRISAEWVAFHREKFYKELSERGIETLGFSKLTEYVLPDESTAILYQRSEGK